MNPLGFTKSCAIALLYSAVLLIEPGTTMPTPIAAQPRSIDDRLLFNFSVVKLTEQLDSVLSAAEQKKDSVKEQHKELRKQTMEFKKAAMKLEIEEFGNTLGSTILVIDGEDYTTEMPLVYTIDSTKILQ